MGDQTQVTFVTPTERKRVTTRRWAAMYWPAALPLTPSLHGYQLPFISWAKRSMSGLPHGLICVAHRRTSASWVPFAIADSR